MAVFGSGVSIGTRHLQSFRHDEFEGNFFAEYLRRFASRLSFTGGFEGDGHGFSLLPRIFRSREDQ